MIWAAPVDALAHLLGMIAGLWLAIMPVLAGQVALHWLGVLLTGRPGAPLLWSYVLPLVALGLTVWLLVVIGLGLLLRRTLALALGGAVLLIVLLQFAQPVHAPELSQLGLFNLLFSTIEPTAAQGVTLYGPLIAVFVLLLFVLGLLALFGAALLALLTDRRRATRLMPLLLLLAAATTRTR